MSKRLLFITGSRGEWGYIRPVLRLCDEMDHAYSLCVTNMHLLPAFGMSVNEIENDGFQIRHKIYMSLDGYNHFSMVKSLGIFLSSLADIVASERPDWIVLAGDRGEQLMGAAVGAFCYIPVAHIQAGEVSGNIDGMTRHAIGKYAHLHFAANEDAVNRLLRLGEESFRVHQVGAPQLDELVSGEVTPLKMLGDKYAINLSGDFLLVVQHPVTEEFDKAEEQIRVTMQVLAELPMPKVVILSNNDAGSLVVREGIHRLRNRDFHIFANLKREDYLGLLKECACIVGNSSSGLLEAPTFKTPAVNIGRRQEGRIKGANVIDVPFEADAIRRGIQKALSAEFKEQLDTHCVNPYGDGTAAKRILAVLNSTEVTDRILTKKLTY